MKLLNAVSSCGLISCSAWFPSQRELFQVPYADALYSKFAFFAAYAIYEIPVNAIAAVVTSAIVAWGIGMAPDWHGFWQFVVVIFETLYCGHCTGILFAM